MSIAIFPGTFDPITLGHLDIIKRSVKIFGNLTIVVCASSSKKPLFTMEERVAMAKSCCAEYPEVKVVGYSGLLPDFIREHQVQVLVRGVRTVADYDYEMQLTGMYRLAVPEVEIVMLPTNGNLSFISSTLVRDLINYRGDITPFVPEVVAASIKAKYY